MRRADADAIRRRPGNARQVGTGGTPRRLGPDALCYHAANAGTASASRTETVLDTAQKILVLRLSSLGDVVLASSMLRSLGEHFPTARIDFAVREDLAAVAGALPGVHRVVAVSRRAGPAALVDLARRLAGAGYAHVFDLHRSLRTRLLVAGLQRRLRPGFSKQELPRWLLVHLHRDVYGRFGGARPMRVRMLEPLHRMGLAPRLQDTQLMLPAAARAGAERELRAAGVHPEHALVGVGPGARWASKRWPVERFGTLVAELARDVSRRLVLVGEQADSALAAVISRRAPASACVDLCGRLDILGTAAVLARCQLLITNDSGLMHVSEAVGRPVLALFGSTTPLFGYAPYRPESRFLHRPPPCNPCSKNGSRPCHRPRHECMEDIGVDEVSAAATAILERAGLPRIKVTPEGGAA